MFLQSDIDKINNLQDLIKTRNPNCNATLITLWETLPKGIWHYYNNTSEGFDNLTWTACLIVLKKWKKFNE